MRSRSDGRSQKTKVVVREVVKNQLFRGHVPFQISIFRTKCEIYSACPEKPFFIETIFRVQVLKILIKNRKTLHFLFVSPIRAEGGGAKVRGVVPKK